jgi:hypothetical protein
MDTIKLWLVGGLGAGVITCAFVLWHWLGKIFDKATQAEVTKTENQTLNTVLKEVKDVKDIHDRIDTDPTYANSVRKEFSRD